MSRALRQIVYDHLCEQLMSGELHSGSRVCELTVAKATGVSRSPVREAIGQLRAEGILEQVPGYGAFVRSPSREDLTEAFQVREWLEAEAVYHLAERVRKGEINGELNEADLIVEEMLTVLRSAYQTDQPALTQDDLEHFCRLDMALHASILKAAGSRKVAKIVGDTRMAIHSAGCRPPAEDATHISQVFTNKDLIMRAVRAGEPELARERMADHIRWACSEALKFYDAQRAKEAEDEASPMSINARRLAARRRPTA